MKSQLLKQCITTIAVFTFILIIGCSDDDNPSGPGNPIDPGDTTSTVTDIDGNVYRTIKIGNQVWMAENLMVTHYRNGDPIPNETDDITWGSLTTGACCSYNNDVTNSTIYGRLYNWFAVDDSRNIAPAGWHVPTNQEWRILIDYLGGGEIAGGKLKEAGNTHWTYPNSGATNESGFTALPSGDRLYLIGGFSQMGTETSFWSSTEFDTEFVYFRQLSFDAPKVSWRYGSKYWGISVRCVKD